MTTRKPAPLVVDDVVGAPYVDVRLDTIPHGQDDPDYSENPAALRRAAQWLLKAAEWLERRQES
jgi:hypothetical protein